MVCQYRLGTNTHITRRLIATMFSTGDLDPMGAAAARIRGRRIPCNARLAGGRGRCRAHVWVRDRPALPRCLRDAAAQGHRQCRRRWRRRRSSHHLDDGRESGDRGDDAGRRKAAAGRVRVDDGQPPMRAGRSARSRPPEKAPLEEESRVPRRAPRRGWCLLA
eukprot:COSAG06_NODE_2039_length_7765_cov_3.914427_8_plen_163_part_00